MSVAFLDRCKVVTSTTGTGTISLGSAVSGYRTFDQCVTDGNLASGQQVYYCIEDTGGAWETGLGTYTSGSPSTLTRTVAESSTGGTALSLSGNATVFATLTGASVITSYLTSGTVSGCTIDSTNVGSTATADDTTTKLATTAFVIGQASSTNPEMNGTVAIGTSKRYARADHVHASDTSRLAAASNLSDVASANTARKNIDQGTASLTSGATVNTDCSASNVFTLTLGTAATLANPTNTVSGAHYQWVITQDATGGRTLAYGTNFKFANGSVPTLSTTANAVDILSATCVGTTLYAVLSNAFA